MRAVHSYLFVMTLAASAVPAAAQDQARPAHPSVCVAIDETHDTLSAGDRLGALMLVGRQFELAGRQIAGDGCEEHYSLAHIRLGTTITVMLTGPAAQREAVASGMNDLPAVYSQLVRAILTGSSVGAMNVVDRGNVTAAQASPKRVQIDSFGYARIGYGGVMTTGGSGNPAIGFGYRAELDSFALDVSFLNQQLPSSNAASESSGAMAGSLLRLEGLYFARPTANASAYFGGGVSWGTTMLSSIVTPHSHSSFSGSGLQGELTAGYELPRASALRVFVQADAALPFYSVTGRMYTYSQTQATTVVTGHRYAPSIVLSAGMGWQRHRQ